VKLSRASIVVAAAALTTLAALAIWRVWPGREDTTPPDMAADPTTTARGADHGDPGRGTAVRDGASLRWRAGPPGGPMRLPSSDGDGGTTASGELAAEFAAEPRDESWAARREPELRDRAARVIGGVAARGGAGRGGTEVRLGDVSCRSRSCRVSLASEDPAALARSLEWLSEEGGFYDLADQMTVRAEEQGPSGPRRVSIYLRFTR
jgi:hypothetical protein